MHEDIITTTEKAEAIIDLAAFMGISETILSLWRILGTDRFDELCDMLAPELNAEGGTYTNEDWSRLLKRFTA